MGTPRECLMQIFGCATFLPGIDLPTRLLSVHERLLDWCPFTTIDQLLNSATLLPYHRPFLTETRYASVREILLQGDGKGLKTQMGRVANRFGANPSLRWCFKCMIESTTHQGSPYWMRRHQLPGVNCCTRHGIQLQYVPLCTRTDKQRFVVPVASCTGAPQVKADLRQLHFAQLSEELLIAGLPVTAPEQRSAAYRHAALELGLSTRHGRIDHRGLVQAIRQRFDDFESFDHRERLLSSLVNPLAWAKDLFERPERSLHPICHLLLIKFLFGSVAAFEKAYLALTETASAGHHKETQITAPFSFSSKEPSSDINYEATLRDTSLSCRKVATLLDRSVTTIVTQRRTRGVQIRERRKTLTSSLLGKVQLELRTDASLPLVANRSGVSLSTVYRILREHPSLRKTHKDLCLKAETRIRRQRWSSALRHTHGDTGVNAARTIAAADYTWLYRHDRAWLTSITRSHRSPRKAVSRVDWEKRDALLYQELLAQIPRLRGKVPPERITKSQLIRPLGETMIRNNLRHLPRLHAHLNEASESHEAFRIRRVDFAISELARTGFDLQLWRIKKMAGIRLWSDALTVHVNNEVDRLNAENPIHSHRLS